MMIHRQVEEVAGGFAAEDYTTELLWVDQPDGAQVPVHFARHNKAYSQDGTAPVLVLAYVISIFSLVSSPSLLWVQLLLFFVSSRTLVLHRA
jgi:prolyl oligopeptidase PreP (S9A serine peptidase family)